MSATQPQIYSAPFDAVAARYDETFTSSRIGTAQRASVWNELANTFHSGDRVLEIGCGTGIDACFMAQRGVQVTACDSSSQMIEVVTRRVREAGQQNVVQPLMLRPRTLPPRTVARARICSRIPFAIRQGHWRCGAAQLS